MKNIDLNDFPHANINVLTDTFNIRFYMLFKKINDNTYEGYNRILHKKTNIPKFSKIIIDKSTYDKLMKLNNLEYIRIQKQSNGKEVCVLHFNDKSTLQLQRFIFDLDIGDKSCFIKFLNNNLLDFTTKNLSKEPLFKAYSYLHTGNFRRPEVESNINIKYISEKFRNNRHYFLCVIKLNTVRYTKNFSISKYGKEKALELTKEWRDNKLKELKIKY